jgi:Uma2 family endonuclease
MVYAPPKRKFNVDDYHRMADAGIFHEDDRVELLDGEIYEMTPIGDGHAGTVNWLSSVFVRRLGDRVVVSPQNPVRLSDYSEPQPDVAVLRRREDFYRSGKPRPEDVLLIIEVAKSSLDYDRLTKLPRYADAGIPQIWIVNLADDQFEVYRKPGEGGYGDRIVLFRGDDIAPVALPDLVLHVDEVLG